MKRIFTLFALMLVAMFGYASRKTDQETADAVRKIKVSQDTYWSAETPPLSLAQLKKNPSLWDNYRQNLKLEIGNQIKSYVYGKYDLRESEINGECTNESRRMVSVSSNLHLKNIAYHEYSKDKKYYIFAYLKRSDFKAQEDEQISRIIGIANKAREMEAEGTKGYLYPYYKAYLMSYNVTRPFADPHGEPDLQFWLENKLYSILKNIPIRSVVYPGIVNKSRPVELLLDNDALSSGLMIDIPSLGFNQLAVTDGKCTLFYDAQPSRRIDEHQICLAINPALVASEKEISELAVERRIMVESRIQLNFSDLIKVDFTYQVDNLSVHFEPSFNNLSLITAMWDLGDGKNANSEEAFEHLYPAGGNYPVQLVVNGEFVVTKTLQLTAIIPDIPPPAEEETYVAAPEPKEILEEAEPIAIEPAPIITIPNPLVIAESFSKEDPHSRELLKLKNYPELLKYLDQQKAEHLLAYGKLSRNSTLDDVWIVIIESDGTVTAILQPQNGLFLDLLTQQQVSDIFATYRGKAAIYISYY